MKSPLWLSFRERRVLETRLNVCAFTYSLTSLQVESYLFHACTSSWLCVPDYIEKYMCRGISIWMHVENVFFTSPASNKTSQKPAALESKQKRTFTLLRPHEHNTVNDDDQVAPPPRLPPHNTILLNIPRDCHGKTPLHFHARASSLLSICHIRDFPTE